MQGSIPPVLLSSMTTEGVCERVHLIEGIDQSMMGNYSATIRKANVNGRVLTQCNIDELKKEMNMNFGDWQLFRASVRKNSSHKIRFYGTKHTFQRSPYVRDGN
ncbi:kinase D-interacting substrate of 220 kDa-like [Notothenia coriiceps]|uniref:Kinase D-interacting substrate of 220 kDa-like n=1 Tax=Notothenia coriiceps TaxID=8208 RepID=A0A6I9N5T5_9TELE|nr:PREDICTED: kinase D-interacting substrate of 220 kDa-like [Notothenia coriiceps]